MNILEDIAPDNQRCQKVERDLCELCRQLLDRQAILECAKDYLKLFPQLLVRYELSLVQPSPQLSQCARPPVVVGLALSSHHIQLSIGDLQRLEETLGAEVVLQYVKQLSSLDFPARAALIGKHITDWTLIWRHSREHRRNAVLGHLTEVAFPFTARTLLRVPEAFDMVSNRTVVTADHFPSTSADTAFELGLFL